jgi:ribonuclease J
VLAMLIIDKRTGKLQQSPEVVMRGFGGADITDEAREVVLKTLKSLSGEEKADYGMVKEKVRSELKRFIQKNTGRRPMIMPVIMEI